MELNFAVASVCVLNVATFRHAPSWLYSANNRKKIGDKNWGAARRNKREQLQQCR
jgi:hypothetical protein